MSKLGMLRERVERASEYIHKIDGVVLTTFNLSAAFLEDHARAHLLAVVALGPVDKDGVGRRTVQWTIDGALTLSLHHDLLKHRFTRRAS